MEIILTVVTQWDKKKNVLCRHDKVMKNMSRIKYFSQWEILGKSTAPVQCRFLIDVSGYRGCGQKIGIKFLVFRIWDNNKPCGAHDFLRLPFGFFKKYC